MSIPNYFPNPMDIDSDCIAVGGELDTNLLVSAYSQGIFPWYNEGEVIQWFCPDPRFVINPADVLIAKSMKKYFNREIYHVTYNQNFEEVITQCQQIKRHGQAGTWITKAMKNEYIALSQLGIAQSVEVWDKKNKLVGGLYGVNLNGMFYGESMFSLAPNASKFGFITLCKKLESLGYPLIDCQVYTDHLASLGAVHISKKIFLETIRVVEKKKSKIF